MDNTKGWHSIHKPELERAEHPVTLEEQLSRLDWYQFEKLMASVFEQQGYSVQRQGGARADGGVDLVITKGSEKTVVQCKHWKARDVGVRHIREFLGTLADAGTQKGLFITSTSFTDDARALAQKHNIQVLGEGQLLQMLEGVNWKVNPAILGALDHTQKVCPKCDSRMVLRTAKKGPSAGRQFWGCSAFPKCNHIFEYEGENVLSEPVTFVPPRQRPEVNLGPANTGLQQRSNLDPKTVALICWTLTFLFIVGVSTMLVMQIGKVFISVVPALKPIVGGLSLLIGLAMGTAAFLELRRALKSRR